MILNYNNLLLHLAVEYMDTLIYSGSFKRNFNPNIKFDTSNLSNNDDKEEEIDDTLHLLENEMLAILYLKKQNRIREFNNQHHPQNVLGDMKKKYFTHPETGIRSIMTYKFTFWFQNYIENL